MGSENVERAKMTERIESLSARVAKCAIDNKSLRFAIEAMRSSSGPHGSPGAVEDLRARIDAVGNLFFGPEKYESEVRRLLDRPPPKNNNNGLA